MHIALLTMSYPPQTGGVQTYLSEIFRRVGREHDVTVVTPVAQDKTVPNALPRLKPSPASAWGYWRALRLLQPDRIVVGHAHPQLLLPAFFYKKSPYLAITHGNDYLAAQIRWRRLIFNRLLTWARPLVTTTNENARRLRQLGMGARAIIPPGVDPEHFLPAPPRDKGEIALLTVGRLVPRKGIDSVLHAISILRHEFPALQYWIAGSGPDEDRLKALCAQLELWNHVRFLGRAPDNELPELYRQADIFVMPVREEARGTSVEGFGIVYLEASASGLPVIAGSSGGAGEAVLDGKTGLLVEPHPEPVSIAVRKLLQDESLRRRLGAAGRRWVEEEMHWDRAAAQMVEALNVGLN